MTTRKFISRFSPNRTDPEDLEKIHVQRHALLDEAVDLVRESARTKNKHHLLFVGSRGCGKTHLLSLINHRLGKQDGLGNRLRIAWLNEDETSTSFLDLLVRIYQALAARYPDEFPIADVEKHFGDEPDKAREAIGESLVQHAGKHTLLVLIENLNGIFGQFDEGEQRTWRSFIQNHPVFATVATAQSLFAGVSEHDQPFFGFFDTRHLQRLTADEANELLQKIAAVNGDAELEGFLKTPRGRARIRAIHHLSHGNHRLYVVLSELITKESLDQLVRPFEEMVDEQLTPYYQERLRWLSPLQRKIVELLCQRGQPIPVKDIADRLFASHSTITPQLKNLREMGYVVSTPRGRESLYELAEPLMRLTMQVKDAPRAEPLGVIVDFLRVWYERDELEDPVSNPNATPKRTAQAWTRFADALPESDSWEPAVRKLDGAFASKDRMAINKVCDALLVDTVGHIGSPRIWQPRVKELAKHFADHGALNHLGDALVRHLSNLATSPISGAGLRQWFEHWDSTARQHEAMRMPLRLLRVGIDFLSSNPKDEGKLLQLPAEERLLLRQALGLPA